MSLYSHEQVCDSCEYAIFHKCCGSFCLCVINIEYEVNHCCGQCEYKKGESERDIARREYAEGGEDDL